MSAGSCAPPRWRAAHSALGGLRSVASELVARHLRSWTTHEVVTDPAHVATAHQMRIALAELRRAQQQAQQTGARRHSDGYRAGQFTASFDAVLADAGIEVLNIPPHCGRTASPKASC